MKIIIAILILILAGIGYTVYQSGQSGKITQQQAVAKVKALPQVQEYLKVVPNGKVEVDNEIEGNYNVHVYEVKDGHTATFNWYGVNKTTGEIKKEF